MRRNKLTLHRKHGIPIALNAGNWLYFRALDQVQQLGLPPDQECELLRYFNRILVRAHFGQALDLGTQMAELPKDKASSVCLASMELKTGALMCLAFDLGAFLAQPRTLPTPEGRNFARHFGIALQMMDDIGNFTSPPPKGKEDLRNGRPSFIWSVASEISNEADYSRLIHASRMLPDESFLNAWVGLFDLIPQAKKRASNYLRESFKDTPFSQEIRERVESLSIKLEQSYV